MKRNIRWFSRIFCGILLFILCFRAETTWAAAGYADLSEMKNGHEVTRDYEVDGDYKFVPTVTEDTEILYSGDWDNLFCRNSEADVRYISRYYPYADTKGWYNTRSAVLSKEKKGKLSVELRNVGEYNGEIIHLKVTLTDWDTFTNLPSEDYANAFITMGGSTRLPQINIICVQKLRVRFSYYNSDGEPVTLKGHYTLNDLDYSQGFRILNSGGEIFYTKEAAARMGYDAASGTIWADSSETEPDRPEGWVTYTFEGAQSDLEFCVNVVNPKSNEYKYRKWDVSRWPGLPDQEKKNLERYYKGAARTDVTEEFHTAWITSEFGYTAEAVMKFGKKGNVFVEKTDSQTQEPLPGAEFVCEEWKGNEWKQTGMLEWNAQEQDYRIFGIKFSAENQGRFRIRETKNPFGYQGTWEQEFFLEEEGTVTFRFQAGNERETGRIRITKKDAADGKAIDGAVFRVTAEKDIRTAGGTLLVSAGTVVDKVTVRDGTAVTKELEFGAYQVQEEVPAQGYLKKDEVQHAVLHADRKELTLEFRNEKNRLTIQKVSKGDGAVLPGAMFRIWKKGTEEEKGSEYITDGDGKIILSGLASGEYCIRETGAPEGYLTDSAVRTITVDTDGRIDGQENRNLVIENAYLELEISKVDASTGQAVPGAELVLYDAEGKEKAVWISGKEPYLLKKLKPGNYTLKERKAPDGYEMAEPVTFVLEEKPGVQKIVMKDLRKTELTIVKRIRADEITWAHGNPVFCFTVEGKDLFGRAYRCQGVTEFSREYVGTHTDSEGMVEKAVTLTGIPMGTAYDVMEQETLRYGLIMVAGTENIRIEKLREPEEGILPSEIFRVTADLENRPEGSRVVFENKKYRWDDYSHTHTVQNIIPLQKNTGETSG